MRILSIFAAFSGAMAVAMGAAAAHILKDKLDANAVDLVEKASLYQMFHAVALLAIVLSGRCSKILKIAGGLFCLGIILFSGSLYAYAFTSVREFVHVTPFGGMAFIAGWLTLFFYSKK